jgi:hypothetical protein
MLAPGGFGNKQNTQKTHKKGGMARCETELQAMEISMEDAEKRLVIDGPFLDVPSIEIVRDFRAHLGATGAPETFEHLSHTRPPLTLKSKILGRFEVERHQRPDGSFIPCSICGPKPKFLSGSLIWSEDGHIRIIGHDCAYTHFGNSTYEALEAEYVKGQTVESNSNFLLSNWHLVAQLYEELLEIETKLIELENVRKKLKRLAPSLYEKLEHASKRNEGVLFHERRMNPDIASIGLRTSSGGDSNFVRETIGRIPGREFFTSLPRLAPQLRKTKLVVFQLRRTESEVLDALISPDSDQISQIRLLISKSANDMLQAVGNIEKASRFLTAETATILRKWAKVSGSDNRYEVSLEGKFIRIQEYGVREVFLGNLEKAEEKLQLPISSSIFSFAG